MLTSRDLDMLTWAAGGLPVQQIAHRAHVSYATARYRMTAILKMLGARERAHAVALIWPQIAHRVQVQTPPRELTSRQIQILALLAEGLTYHEIAAKLGTSIHTIRAQISSGLSPLYDRLGARNRVHAVAIGLAHDLIDAPNGWQPQPTTTIDVTLTASGIIEIWVTPISRTTQPLIAWLPPAEAHRLCGDLQTALLELATQSSR